jgi:hypothetical protein
MTDVQTFRDPAAPGPIPTPAGPLSYIHWGPGIAGAIVAAATSFVLMGFASSVGLMVTSPSPTWRDASLWLVILSGFWIVVVAVGSFALGGYLAGRVRSTWRASEHEIEFRDGVHGLIAWAIGVMLGAALLALTATTFTAGNAASPPRDTAGAPSFLAYELDRLFRPEAAGPELRAEAGRIIMRALGRTELPTEDRAQLVRITSSVSGLAPPDAERRVTQVLTDARAAASQARKSAVILGFCLAAALAAAAAAAWMAAGAGGKHRDGEFAPPLRFGGAAVRRT